MVVVITQFRPPIRELMAEVGLSVAGGDGCSEVSIFFSVSSLAALFCVCVMSFSVCLNVTPCSVCLCATSFSGSLGVTSLMPCGKC